MTKSGILVVLILIAMAALMLDYYSRLKKMGWAPELMGRGRSALDPVGSALGELGRADLGYKGFAALFGGIGKATEMVYAPIGAALSGLGRALEMVFAPIGAVLGMVAGAKR